MALTKVSAAMFSTAAQSSDMNMDDGTLFVDVSENKVGIGNTAPAEALDITGNLTLRSRGYLKLQDDTGGQFVALRAPATVSGSVTYTFPAADGSSGQSLTTDGSGTLSWSAAAPTAGTGVTVSGSQVSIGQAVATSSNVQFNSVKTTLIEYTDGDDAITIADGGHITAAGNVTVTGNLTVNGSTVTNSATNTTIEDLLIELGTGTSGSPASDAGLVLERGSSDNIFIGWDESADVFTVGTGSFTGASTGNLTHTAANAVFGSITGTSITGSSLTIDTATLVVDASNNRVGIGNASPDVSLDIGSYTDAVHVPVGTTGQRPGSPAAGYFRYNSTTSQFEGYTSAWGAIGGGSTTLNTDLFTGNGSTVDFTISQAIDNENKLMVFIDGVYQNPDAYSMPASTTLRFTAAPANSRKIAVYSIAGVVSGTNLNIDSFTGDGSDLTFTLSITPVSENNTLVYVGGVYQQKSTYSVSGTTLTFSTAPPASASIEVATFNQTNINVPVDDTITTAKIVNDAVTADKIVDNIALPGNITTTGTLAPTGALTANAGVVVDNITIDGTEIDLSSGDLTLDVAGDIILDADGGDVFIDDGGTRLLSISNAGSNNVQISTSISDGDLLFKGNDGGSTITALTIDMSDAGTATFNHDIKLASGGEIYFGERGNLKHDASSYNMTFNTNSLANALVITGAGNVGIGTNAPNASLDVVSNSSANGIELRGRSADNIGQLTFESNDSGTTYSQLQSLATELKVKTIANIPMSFHTNNTERMRLDSTGVLQLKAGPTSYSAGSSESSFIYHDNSGNTSLRLGSNYAVAGSATHIMNRTTTIASFLGSGNVDIPDGNLVFADGHGIDFSATGNSAAVTNSELFDDYEEGTFGPGITGTGNSFASGAAVGRYTKIGRMVYAQIFVNNNGSNTFGSGYFVINGLPYTSYNGNGSLIPTPPMLRYLTPPSGSFHLTTYVGAAESQVYFYWSDTDNWEVMIGDHINNDSAFAMYAGVIYEAQ
jgi:hypothetical protein